MTSFFIFLAAAALSLAGCTPTPPMRPTAAPSSMGAPIVADHDATRLQAIPAGWIDIARSRFGVAYGGGSRRQLVAGLEKLELADARYRTDRLGGPDALGFFTGDLRGGLGTQSRHRWTDQTRFRIEKGWGDINVVMWGWDDELTRYTEAEVDLYLERMAGLEAEFPGVVFVYMTAWLDGTGSGGNVHRRNERIRAFCRANRKVLFDLADIQRYGPEGNDYLDLGGDFGGYYRRNGAVRNWADD